MKMKKSLYSKLILSHLGIAGLGFAALLAGFYAIWTLSSSANRLANDIGPTAQASLRIVSGIHASTAAMNGWVAVNDPNFRIERQQAWQQGIYPAAAKLRRYLLNKNETSSSAKLQELQKLFITLENLHEAQWWLQDVAQSPANNQAQYYFVKNIKPSINVIDSAILGVIQLSEGSNSPLLTKIKEFRYQLIISVNELQSFIDDAESQHSDAFTSQLFIGQHIFDDIDINNSEATQSKEQLELLNLIKAELASLERLGIETIRLRNSPQWNVAQYLLSDEIAPLTRVLTEKFKQIAANNATMMEQQATKVEQVSDSAFIINGLLAIIMLTLAFLLAIRNAKSLTKPIATLSKAANDLAMGQLKGSIPVQGDDELASLSHTFNFMSQAIEKKKLALEASHEELERRIAERTEELAISRDLAETTLLSIGDAVISTDKDGIVTMMNPIAEKLTGWGNDEAIGQEISNVFCVINEKTNDSVECPVARCIESNSIILLESDSSLICKNGSHIAIDDSAAPIHDANSNPIGAILVFRNVTHERSLQKKLSYQATHDSLTGLVNRYEFELRMENALLFARTEKRQHSLAFLDLDQFKVVNDTCGHAAGDELLRQLTHLIGEPIRQHDTLARLGGDEFAILLEDCTIDQAFKVCEKIRKDIKSFRFRWDGQAFEVGVSIGITSFNMYNNSITKVLSQADNACYEAKEAGRNCVKISDNQNTVEARKEVQWASKITEAMDESRLVLFAQPIVSISDHTSNHEHCEILVRMLERDGSIVAPGAFLPAAERYNLIQRIDCYVVQKACEAFQNKLFNANSNKPLIISINLSGQSVGSQDVLACIKENLETHNVPAKHFCFEITETAAMNNMQQALAFINDLKEIGCEFALDDFGSGLSSYGYLQNIPVDYVKIDGRFVKNILNDPIDAAMVSSINEITHLMGKKTIAEFVESKEIADKLRDIGVDYIQGWASGKPIAVEEHLAKVNSISVL